VRRRIPALLGAAVLTAALATGCGAGGDDGDDGATEKGPGTPTVGGPAAPSDEAAELERMRRLVDKAESDVSDAESEAAADWTAP
jgi:hypothetical protein